MAKCNICDSELLIVHLLLDVRACVSSLCTCFVRWNLHPVNINFIYIRLLAITRIRLE